jgi:hypothetical protein
MTRGFFVVQTTTEGTKQVTDVIMRNMAADDLASDIVWGVDGIGKVIGRNARQTFHLIDTGKLPVKKIGGRWCASRSGLRKFFAGVLSGEVD